MSPSERVVYRSGVFARPTSSCVVQGEGAARVGRSSRRPDLLEGDRLLMPSEVARLFRVDPKTVTRWAVAGRLGSIRTLGGHHRFRESEVRALLNKQESDKENGA